MTCMKKSQIHCANCGSKEQIYISSQMPINAADQLVVLFWNINRDVYSYSNVLKSLMISYLFVSLMHQIQE